MAIRSNTLLSLLVLSLFWQGKSAELKTELTESLLNFTLRFSVVEFSKSNESQAFSPLCLNMILGAVQQGADGDSRNQIDSLLGFGYESSQSYFRSLLDYFQNSLSDQVFHWGNRIFVRKDLSIDEDFEENVLKNFEMVTQEGNFSDSDFPKVVNDWISVITDEKIQEGVNPTSIPSDASLVFVSAISFTDEWKVAFNARDTEEDFFHVNDATNVTVSFMVHKNRNTTMGQNEEAGLKWIRLDYSKSPSMFILFVLPTKRFGLIEAVEKMTHEHLLEMMTKNETEMANIAIPKFNITTQLFLREPLIELGVVDIFTNKANLSGMVKSDEEIKIFDMSHNCVVEINEKGTTAAAVSSANFQFLSGSMDFPENVAFKADEPFLFFIYDMQMLIPHFVGLVVNPQSK